MLCMLDMQLYLILNVATSVENLVQGMIFLETFIDCFKEFTSNIGDNVDAVWPIVPDNIYHANSNSMYHLTNRFRFSVRVYCNRSQVIALKEQKSTARDEVECRDFLFLPRYGVFCDLLDRFRSRTSTSKGPSTRCDKSYTILALEYVFAVN